MSSLHLIWVCGILIVGGSLVNPHAQGAESLVDQARSPINLGNTQQLKRNLMPPLPVLKSSTTRFRELLAATPAERERMLDRKPLKARAVIESKIREFLALQPNDREIRLRLIQLQDSLRPLLMVPKEQRSISLSQQVAPEDQALITERLSAWDALSEDERRELFESESQFFLFIRQPNVNPEQLARWVSTLPADQKTRAEDQLKRWRALSAVERTRRAEGFARFFDLTTTERQAALGQIFEPEKQQMERTLNDFSKLSRAERDRCIEGFRKFESLLDSDREKFLRNAERWQTLSPDDRATWRRLVERVTKPIQPAPFPGAPSILATTNR